MRHEEMTDPAFATMDDAPRDGLMALVHSTQDRGLGIGMYPDEADLAGVCSYSSERLTRVVSHWIQHNDRIANFVQGLPQRIELERTNANVARIERDIESIREILVTQGEAISDLLKLVRTRAAA